MGKARVGGREKATDQNRTRGERWDERGFDEKETFLGIFVLVATLFGYLRNAANILSVYSRYCVKVMP